MVRKRFESAFERLRDRSNDVAATDRSPENFDEIVEKRAELDALRTEVRDERRKIVSRYEPPATDIVHSARGHRNTKPFGKIAAAVTVVILGAGSLLIARGLQNFLNGFPLVLDEVTESIDPDDGCRWTVQATVRNDSDDETVTIERARTVLNKRLANVWLDEEATLTPGSSATIELSWTARVGDTCPQLNEISHGELQFFFRAGGSVSRGF